MNKEDIKVLQIGVGSMGKRRIRNLHYHGINQISCFDIREDRVEEAADLYQVEKIFNINQVAWEDFTHCIISTPPDCHMIYVAKAVKNKLHVFIEASVLDEGFEEVQQLLEQTSKKLVVAPSCTMRYDPIIVKAKEFLDSGILGKTLLVNHYFGQYLPAWHPYEDIKDFYVSNKKTGAAREIVPFDLVYLTWLFGEIKKMKCLMKNTGTLGVEIDDIYSLLCETEQHVQMSITIDVVSRASYRDTRVICQEGNLEIDNVRGTLKVYKAENNQWEIFTRGELQKSVSTEDMYVQEMDTFIQATLGQTYFPYTLTEDHQVLKYLYQAEKEFHNTL